jgi:hypothetical protein
MARAKNEASSPLVNVTNSYIPPKETVGLYPTEEFGIARRLCATQSALPIPIS